MDDMCRWNLSDIYALLEPSCATFALPRALPYGYSNWLLISAPRDPFSSYLVNNLMTSHRSYGLPYFTVLKSTGPLFVTRMLQELRTNTSTGGADTTLSVYEFSVHDTDDVMFGRTYGATWHSLDGVVIWNLYQYMYQYICVGVVIICLMTYLYRKLGKMSRKKTLASIPCGLQSLQQIIKS